MISATLFPGRYVQGARGYDWTIVNGHVFMEHGERTYEETLRHYDEYGDVVGDAPLNLQARLPNGVVFDLREIDVQQVGVVIDDQNCRLAAHAAQNTLRVMTTSFHAFATALARLRSAPLPKQRRSDADLGRPEADGGLEIVAHAHAELG